MLIGGFVSLYKQMENEALVFATLRHEGQMRKDGEQYINHPIRVMESAFVNEDSVLVENEISIARIAALLHDVVEDTDASIEDVQEMFGSEIMEAVRLLTREDGLTYKAYIDRLMASNNKIAFAVKLGDLTDNINSSIKIEGDTMQEIREKRWIPTYDKLVKIWLSYPERN